MFHVDVRLPLRALTLLLILVSSLATAADIIKSPNDPRDYLAFELNNGLKVLVISDPETDKAAVSLDVSVGSGDDPEQRQGLAHFLEHMLFLGTKKYPEAGDYQAYISAHGGAHNAFTAHDRTNYFFDIDSNFLAPTLDRFARFFVDPLFSAEYVQREKHAVNSEYQSKLKEDGRRGYSAFRQVINPKHPMSGFAVGSLETLADRPGSDIRDELINFYQQHYSADNMSLVILGSETASDLRQLVEDKFNSVAKRPMATKEPQPPLFKPDSLPALMKISSIKEMHTLNMTFPVAPIRKHYSKKPLRFISAMLGQEGEGSLLDILKQKRLAKGLSSGPGLNHQDSATLSISISLTPEGFERYQEVVDLSFQYLRLIQREGLQTWVFEEEKSISNTAFRFKENSNRVYHLTHLAANLKLYPPQEVMRGDYLYQDFDQALINDYLAALTPNNLLLTLTASDQQTDRLDPWFNTPYSIEPLDSKLQQQWAQGPIDKALRIPAPNPFLADDLSLRTEIDTPIPEVIKSSPGYRLWFKQDQQFKTPKADFFVTYRSPIANDSPRHHLLTQLFVKLVNDKLNSFTYPASVAGQHSSLYPHIRGFGLRLSGYRDKQHLLLTEIINSVKTLQVDPKRLAIFQQDLRRQLENSRKDKPYNQTIEEIYLQVMKPQWSTEQQLAELDSINAEELQEFIHELLQAGDIEALAHGNLIPEDALKLSSIVEDKLLKGTHAISVGPGQVKLLGQQQQVKDLDVDHNDSAISIYIQAADKNLSTRASYALLAKILSPVFYTQMRTEKQLGYIVFASAMSILEHPGLALVIQSPSAHPDQLQSNIDRFLTESLPLVQSISEAALAEYKQGILVELLKKDQKLSDRTGRYWREIDRGHLDFNSREQLAEAIRSVSVEDLVSTYRSLGERRLIVRSAGQSLSQGLPDSKSGAGKG
ncbi:MAG: insulinase family protein [Motiliproteus sp.]